ncbi:WD40-repeat-containing domain protein [Dipodascopsis uninucleata]
MMLVNCRHVFIGANRLPGAASVSKNGEIAFAADRFVAIWSPGDTDNGLQYLLKGHQDAVTAVEFMTPNVIVSGSADGIVKIWMRCTKDITYDPNEGPTAAARKSADKFSTSKSNSVKFECRATLEYHSRVINCISKSIDGKRIFIGSNDATVSIWNIDIDLALDNLSLHLIDTMRLGQGSFPIALAVSQIQTSERCSDIVSVGTTNSKIPVFVANIEHTAYKQVAILKGHDDWVHSLAFKQLKTSTDGEIILYLASGSQDRYIRLWKVLSMQNYKTTHESSFLADSDPVLASTVYRFSILSLDYSDEMMLSPFSAPSMAVPSSNSLKSNNVDNSEFVIVFDALLIGHDDWVLSLSWSPSETDFHLLSASADSSLMLWAPDPVSGIWVSQARLGDLSIKGSSSATGSSGGFWVALWDQNQSPSWIATIGRSGGWRVWRILESELTEEGSTSSSRFVPEYAITGHTREVTDLSWSPSGEYLLTTSLDQTTRLFAEWKLPKKSNFTWHEFARPQIHGYDMITVISLSENVFVSAGDEKVIRVFEMPRGVKKLLERLSGIRFKATLDADTAEAASVPSLGLSNKAVTYSKSESTSSGDNNDSSNQQDLETHLLMNNVADLEYPPLEAHLQRHTLFPEIDKLYGHGYEVSCIALSHDRKLLATACRANSATHAIIRLFDTSTWQEITPSLPQAHGLTITRLSFSTDDRFLLSTSRDRLFFIWERASDAVVNSLASKPLYDIEFQGRKGHSRIIWDGAWAPKGFSLSDYIFATASRDKSLKIWAYNTEATVDQQPWILQATAKFPEAVTAIDFYPEILSIRSSVDERSSEKRALLAIGLDNGNLSVMELKDTTCGLELVSLSKFDSDIVPCQTISRIAWRPMQTRQGVYEFAVGSEDSSVRIYSISEN